MSARIPIHIQLYHSEPGQPTTSVQPFASGATVLHLLTHLSATELNVSSSTHSVVETTPDAQSLPQQKHALAHNTQLKPNTCYAVYHTPSSAALRITSPEPLTQLLQMWNGKLRTALLLVFADLVVYITHVRLFAVNAMHCRGFLAA